MQVLVEVIFYLRERVMPRAEPSADCWDWLICTQGQRSRGRGPDNLTGRDWSLLGRHRLERRGRKELAILIKPQSQTHKQRFILCMYVCFSGVCVVHNRYTLEQSVVITLWTEPPCVLFSQDKPQTDCTKKKRTVNVTADWRNHNITAGVNHLGRSQGYALFGGKQWLDEAFWELCTAGSHTGSGITLMIRYVPQLITDDKQGVLNLLHDKHDPGSVWSSLQRSTWQGCPFYLFLFILIFTGATEPLAMTVRAHTSLSRIMTGWIDHISLYDDDIFFLTNLKCPVSSPGASCFLLSCV